jgi:hypothetical protein
MDKALIVKAIKKAIAAGCTAPPAMSIFGADTNFVRAQADVGGEPDVLKAFYADLGKDADMASFASLFSAGPSGGVSIGIEQAGKLLLAQSIASGDIPETVAKFANHAAKNETHALGVMAVNGVKVAKRVQLGPVTLLPLVDVPPSSQRGMALAQDNMGIGPRFALPSAFVIEYLHKPCYYRPKTPQPREETQSQNANDAFTALDEARTLLSLLGIHPAVRMLWSQPVDWIEAGGMGSGWQSAPSGDLHFDREIDADAAQALAKDYFSIDPSIRSKVLRVPLDRLNKAFSERDFTDRVIDLGIGLEALLLHNLGKDRGELSFRFSLHGAWLLGATGAERTEIHKMLRSMYQLRSQAVHVGEIDFNQENSAVFGKSIELCQRLIRAMIERMCKVDWSQLVMGNHEPPTGGK